MYLHKPEDYKKKVQGKLESLLLLRERERERERLLEREREGREREGGRKRRRENDLFITTMFVPWRFVVVLNLL